MTGHTWRRPVRGGTTLVPLVAFLFAALALLSSSAGAQYFGRNKVQYEEFKWRIIRSDHFDNYFYPPESLIVNDAARMAERWYARYTDTFRHAFDRKSLIFYADHPDFEQTNVIGEQLTEETGGVTEGLRTRVIMPFTGIYGDNNHVLGHELVHVFQYNIGEAAPGGLARLNALPLWLIEGMAEYFSLGRDDPLTAMWMRDAVMRNKFPTIKQLTTDPRFFPYRYGQALWAYVAGRWGERAIVDLYRTALRTGWDPALVRVLGENSDSLSKDWAAANKAQYLPVAATRTHPDSVGTPIIPVKRSGEFNVAPALSPDGRYVAFYSSRDLFGIDLFLADAKTGHIIKKLVGPESDRHFDALSFINSSGDWSPDSKKLAFIAFESGDNVVGILDVRSDRIEQRIKLPGVGAISGVAWSPDGHTLAVSGQSGGISDLYLYDLSNGQTRRLTNDRNADLQPAWSPDGKTIAFATDRGPQTNFETMVFSPLEVATMDVATGKITVLTPLPTARHNINPQWSPDGRDLFFISDPDGVPDVYRVSLATGEARRVTKVATGVSGITSISPAITVARATGELQFAVFKDQGHEIESLPTARLTGEPVVAATAAEVADASVLPPGPSPNGIVTRYLADATTGLVSGSDFHVLPYHPGFQLDALGQPSVGVQAGGPFGTGVAGGVSAMWGDQLSDQQIFGAIQANGTVKDVGGAVYYYNMRKRWNWGAGVEHIPYLTGGVYYDVADPSLNCSSCYSINYLLERIFIDQASFMAQYPFSSTRRMELSANLTRQGYQAEVLQYNADGNYIINQVHKNIDAPKPIYYAQPSLAYVGDWSYAAFTSPVIGGRYRLEYSPTIGTMTFQTMLADWRRYIFMRPLTLAVRGLHYGRYGKDSENQRLYPLFLGEETLIRGYGYGSFTGDECTATGVTSNNQASQACPVLDRLFGSRVDVANVELRIPLFGTSDYGLLNVPFLPTEIAPFFDAGISYTSTQAPQFRLTRNDTNVPTCAAPASADPTTNAFYPCAERIPVFSTGVTARINLLGYMIFEAYLAHPFQRPNKGWVTGFQLAPGW